MPCLNMFCIVLPRLLPHPSRYCRILYSPTSCTTHGPRMKILFIPGHPTMPLAVPGLRAFRLCKSGLGELRGNFWRDKSLRRCGRHKKCRPFCPRWQACLSASPRRNRALRPILSTIAGSLARSTWLRYCAGDSEHGCHCVGSRESKGSHARNCSTTGCVGQSQRQELR